MNSFLKNGIGSTSTMLTIEIAVINSIWIAVMPPVNKANTAFEKTDKPTDMMTVFHKDLKLSSKIYSSCHRIESVIK
jgi:hypothetical protein